MLHNTIIPFAVKSSVCNNDLPSTMESVEQDVLPSSSSFLGVTVQRYLVTELLLYLEINYFLSFPVIRYNRGN